jgi:hypothetical protein
MLPFSSGGQGEYLSASGKTVYLRILKSRLSDISTQGIVDWAIANQVVIVYELANEVIEQYEAQTLPITVRPYTQVIQMANDSIGKIEMAVRKKGEQE